MREELTVLFGADQPFSTTLFSFLKLAEANKKARSDNSKSLKDPTPLQAECCNSKLLRGKLSCPPLMTKI